MANHIPVAIGGVGGSGTRVVAGMLRNLGFYIGDDLNISLNISNDNLWFTLLLKRPAWFYKNHGKRDSVIYKGLSIFEKLMSGTSLSASDIYFIMRAALDMSINGHDNLRSGRGKWAFERASTMLKACNSLRPENIRWGWKEPNTHIFIKYLADSFDRIKYIHVIRHGLDMAYSSNQAQLFNWGRLFGVTPDPSIPLHKASLMYWIRANERAIDLGEKLLGKSFFLLNFDRLCLNPVCEINRLLDFLETERSGIDLDSLYALPKIPKSLGRYNNHDTTIFNNEEIKAVMKMGFEVIK